MQLTSTLSFCPSLLFFSDLSMVGSQGKKQKFLSDCHCPRWTSHSLVRQTLKSLLSLTFNLFFYVKFKNKIKFKKTKQNKKKTLKKKKKKDTPVATRCSQGLLSAVFLLLVISSPSPTHVDCFLSP